LKRTSFEPELPTRVVIDRGCVGRRPIGATAWSTVEGREYDDVAAAKDGEEQPDPAIKLLLEQFGIAPELVEKLGEDDEGEDERNIWRTECGGTGEDARRSTSKWFC
jgi:hypothetical protein